MRESKQRILSIMAEAVAVAVAGFDRRTGRFLHDLEGPAAPDANPEDLGWGITNQDIIYPLAVLYTSPGTDGYEDPAILEMALRGGDAIRDFQYPDGRVEFLKADGSRWGPTYMCWTNYAWLETWNLLREHLDPARRTRWEEGLTLAHDGQMREVRTLHVHNIPCWKAMSCYRAGVLFDREDWREAGAALIRAAVEAQQPGGYWAEHGGPSTLYNHVYVHALGLHYRFSGDKSLLPALEAATEFHQTFLYPNGAGVETVDGRVKYGNRVMTMGWVGFSACPAGRRLVRFLTERLDANRNIRNFQGGSLASSAQHLIEGDEAPIHLDRPAFRVAYRDWAVVRRETPWFACLSGFVCPPVASRWGQDRQAFLSLWHDDFGLLLGGGNSKEQPEWSSFVADGKFIPDKGELLAETDGVALTYGRVRCLLRLRFEEGKAVIEAEAEHGPALQQFVLQSKAGDRLRSAAGGEAVLGDAPLCWDGARIGAWLEVRGCRIAVPPGAEFRWPSRPFHPYAIDGVPPYGAEVGVLSARLDGKPLCWEFTFPGRAGD